MKIKTLTLAGLFAAACAAAPLAQAHDYHRGWHDKPSKGERLNRKYDRAAAKAARRGDYEKAARLDRKGDRLERHYDRRDRRHYHQHGYRQHFRGHYRDHHRYDRHHYRGKHRGHHVKRHRHHDDKVRVFVRLDGIDLRL